MEEEEGEVEAEEREEGAGEERAARGEEEEREVRAEGRLVVRTGVPTRGVGVGEAGRGERRVVVE